MNRNETVTSWQRALILLITVMSCAFWVVAIVFDPMYFYVAVGTGILAMTLLPVMFSKDYDWFCPWSALILAVIYGCTLPSVCMSFGMPSHEFVSENILLHESVDYFVWPSALLFLFIGCLGLGYFFFPVKQTPFPVKRVCCPKRLLWICAICGALSIAAFGAYFMFNGGFSAGLSTKRATIRTLDVGADTGFSQHGWLRHFAKLGTIALLLLAAYWSRYRVPTWSVNNIVRFMILSILILVAIAFPFYSSSRSGMVWVVISFAGCLYYMNQKIITFRTLTLGAAFVSLVVFMSLVRNSGSESSDGMAKRFGHLLLNRHGPDIAVTAHIIQNIPEKFEFQYGKTIAVWLLAPIPREILPSKPLIHSGPIIGQRVYQLNVSGVPPGSAAELYWNFHIAGIIFGGLILGSILKFVYQMCKNVQLDPMLMAPIYIFAVFPSGFKVAMHSVGPAFVMPVLDLVTVCVVVYAVSVRESAYAPAQSSFPVPVAQGVVSSQ